MVLFVAIIDYGVSVNDRAALREASRIGARAAARVGVQDEGVIVEKAKEAVRESLGAAGYQGDRFREEVRIVELPLNDDRLTKAVELTVVADSGLRPWS